MACGHVSDSAYTDPEGNRAPVCGKCFTSQYANSASRKDAKTVVSLSVLRNRSACCWIGEQPGGRRHSERPSNLNLPNFKYDPNKQVDTWYCGCLEKFD
jgi:hypothetical protein